MSGYAHGLLIRLLGVRRYLHIRRAVRLRLSLPCGEDFSRINAALDKLRACSSVASAGGMTPASPRPGG